MRTAGSGSISRTMAFLTLGAALFASVCAAQTLNPPYLKEMPAVERVMAAMQVSEAKETTLRQMGTFRLLQQVIKDMAGSRAFHGQLTPDEVRILGEYALAYDKLAKPLNYPFDAASDPRFREEVFKMFNMNECRAQYIKVNAEYAARHQARIEAEQKQFEDAQKRAAAGAQSSVPNDPGAVAMRRCIESGRNQTECLGEGLKTGLFDLVGATPLLEMTKAPTGLRMTGVYPGAGGFRLLFLEENVEVACGTLVPDPHDYLVQRKDGQILVKVGNGNEPMIFALRPDGKLVGSGTVTIQGRVVVGQTSQDTYGMVPHTTTQQKQISQGEARQYALGEVHQNGMDYSVNETTTHSTYEKTGTVSTPVYAAKTEHCTLAALTPSGPTVTQGKLLATVVNSVAGDGGPLDKAAQRTMRELPSPGLRMSGQYVGDGGLQLEFRNDSTMVECGEAHVSAAYTVSSADNRVTIHVQNPAAPFTLTFESDGRLMGTGSVDVAGRVVAGSNAGQIVYAPRNARCNVGTLSPKGSGAAATPKTTAKEIPAASAAPANANPSVAAAAPANVPANAVLEISSGFATGANPLAGRSLVLMKDSIDNVLRKLGAPIPANATPFQAWQAWMAACRPPADCKALNASMATYGAGGIKLDSNGKGSFAAVPPGIYYVMVAVGFENKPVFWDVRAELKPGTNAVTLSLGNAEK